MGIPAWLQSAVLISAISVLIVLLAGIWWWVPRWSADQLRLKVRDAKARADIEDNFRKTLSQLFGGVALLLGAAFAYYQTQITAQQARDLLISQQTSKGFEQLGSGEVIIRLGGIYALEGVMNASLVYHVPVMEALAAFIREKVSRVGEPANLNPDEERPPPTDVQAALTVLGRRSLYETETRGVDLTQTHLQRANLSRANFFGADFSGANLGRASLIEANLSGTLLVEANFSNAVLVNANLSRALVFCTDFSRANLSGTNLSEAVFVETNLSEAKLTGANLSGTHLADANLSGADLSEANLIGADLSGTNLANANLSKILCDAQTRFPPDVQLSCTSTALR